MTENFIKNILLEIKKVFDASSWVQTNIKKIYSVDIHPNIISLFPAIAIFPVNKVEILTTMPVSQRGRFVEFTYDIRCYQKFMNIELARLGSDNDLGLYDMMWNIEEILRANSDLNRLIYWSELPSSVLNIQPYNETAFLAVSITTLIAKRKI